MIFTTLFDNLLFFIKISEITPVIVLLSSCIVIGFGLYEFDSREVISNSFKSAFPVKTRFNFLDFIIHAILLSIINPPLFLPASPVTSCQIYPSAFVYYIGFSFTIISDSTNGYFTEFTISFFLAFNMFSIITFYPQYDSPAIANKYICCIIGIYFLFHIVPP